MKRLKKKFNEKIVLIGLIITNILLYPMFDPDSGFLYQHHKFMDKSNKIIESEFSENSEMSFVLGSSYYGDTENYIKMAKGDSSISPYKYRVLYPGLVGFISNFWFGSIDYIPIIYTSIFINYIICLFILMFTFSYFKNFSDYPLLISLCILTSPGIFKTLPNLMIEIPSVLIMILILVNWKNKLILPFLLIIAMLTKEVFVLLSMPLFFWFFKNRSSLYLFYSLIPPLIFVFFRIWFNDDPLSVNYGWKLSQGELNLHYLKDKFGTLKSSIITLCRILFILSPFLLFFVKKYSKYGRFFKQNLHWIFFIMLVIISGLFLSSRLIRPWVIITPVIFYLVYTYNEKKSNISY